MVSIIDMEDRMRPAGTLTWVVQGLCLALAALSLVGSLAWVLGPNGADVVPLYRLGEAIGTSEQNTVAHEAVVVSGRAGVATAAAANEALAPQREADATSASPSGFVEFYGAQAQLSFWGLGRWESLAWTGTRALPLLGLSLIWLLLALTMRDVRRGDVFTTRVARRVAVIGGLVLVGVPVTAVLRQVLAVHLVESSWAADIADAAPAALVPWWSVVVGLVLLVLATAWREAAVMRRDLEGLV
ncbi:DUF2975 domain-containing protein [Nocardioides bruguierae]|uniref:DUF2975 domain-containing protein n=1 Tax=Nocardioides bruguierae TaxID=2945102 RepID=UPI0020219767|nr:DUF2975 domain-containing protein [Nocardioides bruguierae]MCL8024661.1 DUF2975 domain-containing protein [Nocardioides bruguierae]